MITAEKEIALNQIARSLEFTATTLEKVGKSIDYLSGNIDEQNLFPTIKSIREDLQQDMKDLKSTLAQLENADAELQRMQ